MDSFCIVLGLCVIGIWGAMLYVVGLGLGDERDITVRGLEAVRKCDKVYLEAYTSLLALGLGPDATTTLVSMK